ncbi:MAG: PAS domain S-box protein [Pseudomonadota bacterium]
MKKISKKKRTEQALQESDDRYRFLVENALEAIIVIQDGAIKFANLRCVEIFGYSMEEIILRPFIEFIHPDDRQIVMERYLQRMEGKKDLPDRYSLRGIDKSGSVRWVEISATIILWEGRDASLSIVNDITERKRTEEALRKSEKQLREVASKLPGVVFQFYARTNGEMGVSYISDQAEEIFGLNPGSEKLFEDCIELVIPEYRDGFMKSIEEAVSGLTDWASEGIMRKPSGEIKWFSAKSSPTKYENEVIFNGVLLDITEHKRAEQALQESEEKYRLLVESALEAIFIVQDEVLKFSNCRATEIFGYSQEEIILRPFAEFIHPDDLQPVMERYLQLLEGKEDLPYRHCFRVIDKSGSVRWVETSANLVAWEGRGGALLCIVYDITERKRTEQALRESEEKYQLLVENAMDAIYIAQDGIIKFANRRAIDLYGYSMEEIINRPFADFIYPDDLQMVTELYVQQLEGNKDSPERYSFRAIDKSGSVRWSETSTNLVVWEGRKASLNIIHDITERKQIEDALQSSEERFRTLAENAPDIIYTTDRNGVFNYTNPAFGKILGYSTEDVIGKTVLDFAEGEGTRDYINLFKQVRDKKETVRGVYGELRHKDGSIRLFEISASPNFNPRGKTTGVVGLLKDITKQKETEDRLRESREQLRNLSVYLQSVREQERKNIAREIHDELGQMLTALKMDIFWLKKRLPKDQKILIDKTESIIQTVDSSVKVTKKIISDLRPGLLDDLGLTAAIEWQAEDFQNRTGIKCIVSIEPEEMVLNEEYSTTLFRIFQEAMTNIARHANATKVDISLTEESGSILLKVNDNGNGINEKQIFSPNSFGLLGIRERVYALGGKVQIKGYPGKGTMLIAEIPAI